MGAVHSAGMEKLLTNVLSNNFSQLAAMIIATPIQVHGITKYSYS